LRPPSQCFGEAGHPAPWFTRKSIVREREATPVPEPPPSSRRELLKMRPLAGAAVLLQWHYTFAWLLTFAMVIYFSYQIVSRNGRQVLFAARDVRGVWPMARHYFLFGPKPVVADTYNPLQKMAYSVVLGLIVVSLVTGFALYKPVQLSWLVYGLGGFRLTRIWHFAAMCGLLAFIPGHLVMVALHGWRNFAGMWTGGKMQ
jgi:thiosulfate reductase cytochrome b subunit